MNFEKELAALTNSFYLSINHIKANLESGLNPPDGLKLLFNMSALKALDTFHSISILLQHSDLNSVNLSIVSSLRGVHLSFLEAFYFFNFLKSDEDYSEFTDTLDKFNSYQIYRTILDNKVNLEHECTNTQERERKKDEFCATIYKEFKKYFNTPFEDIESPDLIKKQSKGAKALLEGSINKELSYPHFKQYAIYSKSDHLAIISTYLYRFSVSEKQEQLNSIRISIKIISQGIVAISDHLSIDEPTRESLKDEIQSFIRKLDNL